MTFGKGFRKVMGFCPNGPHKGRVQLRTVRLIPGQRGAVYFTNTVIYFCRYCEIIWEVWETELSWPEDIKLIKEDDLVQLYSDLKFQLKK